MMDKNQNLGSTLQIDDSSYAMNKVWIERLDFSDIVRRRTNGRADGELTWGMGRWNLVPMEPSPSPRTVCPRSAILRKFKTN